MTEDCDPSIESRTSLDLFRHPIADTAELHQAYKHFDGLGEERYPIFLAVPVRGKAGALGLYAMNMPSEVGGGGLSAIDTDRKSVV